MARLYCARVILACGEVLRDSCVEVDDEGLVSGYGGGVPAGSGAVWWDAILPSLCTGHSHLLDYALAEAGEELGLARLFSQPSGLKYQLLLSSQPSTLPERLEKLSRVLAGLGVGAVASYAELGCYGGQLLSRALGGSGLVLRLLVQAWWKRLTDYLAAAPRFWGVGLDTVYDLEPSELRRLVWHVGAGRVQVHVSETRELYEARDYEVLVEVPGLVVVHATYLGPEHLGYLLGSSGLVFCPSSELGFEGRMPDPRLLRGLRLEGIPVALGVDNAGWNPLDPLYQVSVAYLWMRGSATGWREELAQLLLEAATSECRRMLGAPCGLCVGEKVDAIGVRVPELAWSGSPLATLAKRGFSGPRARILGEALGSRYPGGGVRHVRPSMP